MYGVSTATRSACRLLQFPGRDWLIVENTEKESRRFDDLSFYAQRALIEKFLVKGIIEVSIDCTSVAILIIYWHNITTRSYGAHSF